MPRPRGIMAGAMIDDRFEFTAGDERQPLVSIRELARQLDVSHSTVSMALRGSSRISAGTRDRVLEVARAAGYRPDPVFTALHTAGRRKTTIAWLGDETGATYESARRAGVRHGYAVEALAPRHGMTAGDLHDLLIERNVVGLLVAPVRRVAVLRDFPWHRLPVVAVGGAALEERFLEVGPDRLADAILALRTMSGRGLRKIGLVITDKASPLAVAARLLAMECPLFPLDTPGRFRPWLAKHRPDAVLADHPRARRLIAANEAAPAVAFLQTEKPGRDAGIKVPHEEIGTAAFQMLETLILCRQAGPPAIPHRMLLEGRWVDGESLPVAACGAS